ncbi:MAG: tetratricopeptide repeat protein [Candidatus Eisenbacteria sp.]|nr:tetratricopeptide repeat protein [Candidatus Eisenbacteria bacterium]
MQTRFHMAITVSLAAIWLVLIAFGVISRSSPGWLKDLARVGTKIESQVFVDQGDIHMRARKYQSAVASYQRALEIKPDYVEPRLNQAIAYARSGQLDLGVRTLREALETGVTQAEKVYYNLADLLVKQEKWDEAIQCYREALNLGINPGIAYHKMGTVYLGRNEHQKAREALENSLAAVRDATLPYLDMLQSSLSVYEDDPVNLRVVEEQIAAGIREEDLALYDMEIIRRTNETSPRIARLHNLLGFACASLEDYDAAIAHFERSLEIRPGDAKTQKNLEALRGYGNQREMRVKP